jgi:hypothetical protein
MPADLLFFFGLQAVTYGAEERRIGLGQSVTSAIRTFEVQMARWAALTARMNLLL